MDSLIICDILSRNGISSDNDLGERLQVYFTLLQEWNKKIDLFAEAEEYEFIDRHFIDSLSVLNTGLITQNARLIDVGSGAGFPGLALALARADLSVVLLDSQEKRTRFLELVVRETGARNATVIHERAEILGKVSGYRESFDIAAARALAPVNVLSEYLLPFVRKGGKALCWKGPALNKELKMAGTAVARLGGRLEKPVLCSIAGRDWEHLILPICKTAPTPGKYPRRPGTPRSDPL